MNKISIFIPVYHRDETVKVSVQAILDTMGSKGFDVKAILVDNRSSDELRKWLCGIAEDRDDVEVMLLSKNYGKADAINMASRAFSDFDFFIGCDSDILPKQDGWAGILAECFTECHGSGMLSTDYVNNGNSPMPKQPKDVVLRVDSGSWRFRYGGPVAGGCFITSSQIWKELGYRASGVYGGVDGVFRQNVAETLMKKCGYIEKLFVEHMDDRKDNEGYHKWKMGVQDKIREIGPLQQSSRIGNDKGYWDK